MNGKIIIKMGGGLGNQLFGYAFGRAMSLKTGRELVLDISGFRMYKKPLRRYLLNNYNINVKTFGLFNNFNIINYILYKRIKKYFGIELFKPSYFNQTGNTSFISIPTIQGNKDIIYEGGWQSPKYFEEYQNIIKNELTLKKIPNISPDILNAARQPNSISIHFRRTDYVPLDWSGNWTSTYYPEAMKFIKSNIINPRFFVFSDDIEWVKKNYSFGENAVFCSTFGLKDYEELYLMSECTNHIMSNSTFSWWGAYLSKRQGITITPKECLPTWIDQNNIYIQGWKII